MADPKTFGVAAYRLLVGAAVVVGLPVCGWMGNKLITSYEAGQAETIKALKEIKDQIGTLTNVQGQHEVRIDEIERRLNSRKSPISVVRNAYDIRSVP